MRNRVRFLKRLPPAWVRGAVLAAALFALFAIVTSCGTVRRSIVVLPDYPGAKYIGSRECETCHDEIYREFQTADHARLITEGKIGLNAGCESCHGPGSEHSDSGGEIKPPISFSSGRPPINGAPGDLTSNTSRAVENVCFTCHGNVRGEFNLPNHHPVPEGRMTCTECHSPHRGGLLARGGAGRGMQNESCLECHAAQRGPHTFEHEAMRDGCTTCHTAHGSVNAKMLTVRDSNLCLKCHFQQVNDGRLLIGGSDHTFRVQQGGCWTAGCHEAVHGSRVSPSLRF